MGRQACFSSELFFPFPSECDLLGDERREINVFDKHHSFISTKLHLFYLYFPDFHHPINDWKDFKEYIILCSMGSF